MSFFLTQEAFSHYREGGGGRGGVRRGSVVNHGKTRQKSTNTTPVHDEKHGETRYMHRDSRRPRGMIATNRRGNIPGWLEYWTCVLLNVTCTVIATQLLHTPPRVARQESTVRRVENSTFKTKTKTLPYNRTPSFRWTYVPPRVQEPSTGYSTWKYFDLTQR